MTKHVRIENDDGVLCITLNRPEKKNAPTPAMYAAMTAALGQAVGSDDICAVLNTGSGDSFTSGNDITGLQRFSAGHLCRVHRARRTVKRHSDIPLLGRFQNRTRSDRRRTDEA
jgi:enoyl-CoA hydratase/carnithine racemase